MDDRQFARPQEPERPRGPQRRRRGIGEIGCEHCGPIRLGRGSVHHEHRMAAGAHDPLDGRADEDLAQDALAVRPHDHEIDRPLRGGL